MQRFKVFVKLPGTNPLKANMSPEKAVVWKTTFLLKSLLFWISPPFGIISYLFFSSIELANPKLGVFVFFFSEEIFVATSKVREIWMFFFLGLRFLHYSEFGSPPLNLFPLDLLDTPPMISLNLELFANFFLIHHWEGKSALGVVKTHQKFNGLPLSKHIESQKGKSCCNATTIFSGNRCHHFLTCWEFKLIFWDGNLY